MSDNKKELRKAYAKNLHKETTMKLNSVLKRNFLSNVNPLSFADVDTIYDFSDRELATGFLFQYNYELYVMEDTNEYWWKNFITTNRANSNSRLVELAERHLHLEKQLNELFDRYIYEKLDSTSHCVYDGARPDDKKAFDRIFDELANTERSILRLRYQ